MQRTRLRVLCLTAAALITILATCWPAVAGARELVGTPKADTLTGGKRADAIRGGKGNDRLNGRAGNDRLNGGKGNDRLNGGKGKDMLDCGPGRDRAAADPADTVRRNCETVSGLPDEDDGSGGEGGGGGGGPMPPPLSGQFDGVLTTTVRYLSVCTGQVLADQTTQIPSRVTIGPPLQPNPADLPADTPELNPLNLILGQTNVAGTIAPGSVNIASAARFRFSPIRSLTLKYWTLALAGNQLTGTLTEDNREAGAAFNLLAAHQELLACNPNFGTFVNQLDIAEGATLTGTVSAQQVQLRISGRSFAGFHQFTAEITANRNG